VLYFIIGFGCGYFFHKIMTIQIRYDMMLAWDPNTLAWRSVHPGSRIDSSKRYLAAIEINPDHLITPEQ